MLTSCEPKLRCIDSKFSKFKNQKICFQNYQLKTDFLLYFIRIEITKQVIQLSK